MPRAGSFGTARYSYMRYHGVWDINELYDLQSDPAQMRNLLADNRITAQPGPLLSNIRDQRLRSLVAGFNQRIAAILDADWLT